MLTFELSCGDVNGDEASVLPPESCLAWLMITVPALCF